MSLPIQYRPETLKEVYGCQAAVKVLESILKRSADEIPHAYLITGPSGCGKTTLARILASELGAYDSHSKSNMNYVELNSSDFRGIDTIRSIADNIHLSPTKGKYRVWLLDEAHQLTKQAQEAMLKYLEDAPSHVIFILCTTNPEKLTITLKRRCTILEVKPCSTDEIIMLLNEICESEGVKVPSNLIELIEEKALGSPGIALQMLDKIIDLSPKDMKQAITDYQSEEEQAFKLCQLLIKKAPWKEITALLKQLENQDPEGLRRMILGYCKSVLLNGQNNRAACIIECFWEPLHDIGFPGLVFCCYQSIH